MRGCGWPPRPPPWSSGLPRRPGPGPGPLTPGWTRRSGTPAALLARSAGNSAATAGAGAGGGSGVSSGSSAFPAVPFTAQLSGTVAFGSGTASGDRTVTLALADGSAVRLKVVISGPPVSGGVEMTTSSVSLGPASAPAQYTGQLVDLAGTSMQATVSGAGQRLALFINLTSQTSSAVTGTITAQQAGEGE